jgi:ribosomal protein S18 acetylase RimI-like enzyme
MRQKIIKAAAIIIAISFLATIIYYYLPQTPATQASNIIPFDDARDTAEILDIFKKDRYWLVASENYSPELMLKNRAPNQEDVRYFGKLNIRVLYEQNQFVGFTAYYLKNFFVGVLLFIDVKPEFRGKGYAQQLMQYAIEDMKKQGATLITLVTRTSNESAQKLYKRLGFKVTYEEDGYVYFELR